MNKIQSMIEEIKKSNLAMNEMLQLISILVVDELKTPRCQVTINTRKEQIVEIIKEWLSFYKPEDAVLILSDVAIDVLSKNPSYMKLSNFGFPDEYII